MAASDGNWIAEGLRYADESCPFCGQGVRDLPLIAAYRSVFSERYKALSADIEAMKSRVERDMGAVALGRFSHLSEQNISNVEFWKKYCTFQAVSLSLPSGAVEAIRAYAETVVGVLRRKAAVPLEPIALDANFIAAQSAYGAAAAAIEGANAAIKAANTIILEKKAATDAGDLKTAEAALIHLKAIQTRHGAGVSDLCATYSRLSEEKADIDQRKEAVRKMLDAHTLTVVKPYERRINDYLAAFNAGFTITETKHAYPGGMERWLGLFEQLRGVS